MCKTFSINAFNVNGHFLHPLKTFIFHVFRGVWKRLVSWNKLRSIFSVRIIFGMWNIFESWVWEKLQPFWFLLAEIFFWMFKNLCSCKTSFIKEKFLFAEKFLVCEKFSWLSKFLFVEKFLHCGKIPRLWKSSLKLEKFLDQGNLLVLGKCTWSMKISLTVKNIFSWLQKKW